MLRLVLQPQGITTSFSAAAAIQQRQNFKVPTSPSSLWKGGREGSAWHLLFTFQAPVETSHGASREACVHLIHACVWMPAQGLCHRAAPARPLAHTTTPACRAIAAQIKFLIPGTQTLLSWVQGGLCLLHKWLLNC